MDGLEGWRPRVVARWTFTEADTGLESSVSFPMKTSREDDYVSKEASSTAEASSAAGDDAAWEARS
jgi:hypothetical protein